VVVTRTVPPGAAQQAAAFLARFTAGRCEEVLEDVDDVMRPRHDAAGLANGWSQMFAMFGSYEQMGAVSPFPVGESIVVDVLLHFEAGEATMWVRSDRDGKVSGLCLHPAVPWQPQVRDAVREHERVG
jgi:hypothetical protein